MSGRFGATVPSKPAKILCNFVAPQSDLVNHESRMSEIASDLRIYSPEHLIEQAKTAREHLGYKLVEFYVDDEGLLAKGITATVAQFYLSPSGGTLRDADLNIVLYSAKFDLYKGYGRAT